MVLPENIDGISLMYSIKTHLKAIFKPIVKRSIPGWYTISLRDLCLM